MNGQSISREPIHCYACQNQTDERCSYCLLPVCAEHGKRVQPWFTSRVVMVCTPCQAKLEDIAQQEQSLEWAANAQQHTAVLHVLPSERL
jgi:hypothetical protein